MTIRKKAFIVASLWGLVFLIHAIDHSRFDIIEDRRVGKSEELAFTSMPPKQHKRVIFLGNCVWETDNVIPFLNKLKQKAGMDFETGNFARQGATVGDLLVAYNYIKKFKPDLVLVHLHPFSFGYSPPFYKHAARKLIFLPEMRGLWHPLVFQTFSNNELADSVLYSYFPLLRVLPFYQYRVKTQLKEFLAPRLRWSIMDFFPYALIPNERLLNVKEKWVSSYEYPMAKPIMKFFIDQLEADHQKAVFIIQETTSDSLPAMDALPSLFEGKKYCVLQDFRKYYTREDFDGSVIHPNATTGSLNAAVRILQVIGQQLY